MQVFIDPHSGFCFGVVHAIEVAERELTKNHKLYCLGDIVHNNMEVNRLKSMGLVIIDHDELTKIHDCKVLIRAHGEPPETYRTAMLNNIELIDASCPIVLQLQNAIHQGYLEMVDKNGQIVIYGKDGHAEVKGLMGQTNNTAIVVSNDQDLQKIDFSHPVRLYSQTTKSLDSFYQIKSQVLQLMKLAAGENPVDFECHDSICRQVSNRSEQLRDFSAKCDVVIFVSGLTSSNGMILFQECSAVNPKSYLVSGPADLRMEWFDRADSVGICGATSTPTWLMEEVKLEIQKINR